MFGISMGYIWIGITILLVIIEAASVNLVTIWFAVGSLASLLMALIGLSIPVQVIVGLIVSTLLLIYSRPIAIKYLKVGRVKTNVNSVIGQRGVVTKTILQNHVGEIKVGGQYWTAKSSTNEVIELHSEVEILAVEGVKAIVKK